MKFIKLILLVIIIISITTIAGLATFETATDIYPGNGAWHTRYCSESSQCLYWVNMACDSNNFQCFEEAIPNCVNGYRRCDKLLSEEINTPEPPVTPVTPINEKNDSLIIKSSLNNLFLFEPGGRTLYFPNNQYFNTSFLEVKDFFMPSYLQNLRDISSTGHDYFAVFEDGSVKGGKFKPSIYYNKSDDWRLIPSKPIYDVGINNALTIASNYYVYCSLLSNSSIACWKKKYVNQGSSEVGFTKPIIFGKDVKKIVVGVIKPDVRGSFYSIVCGLYENNSVDCWNMSTRFVSYGTEGFDIEKYYHEGQVLDVGASLAGVCFLKEGGLVKCKFSYRFGSFGMLGENNYVEGLANVKRMFLGYLYSCYLMNDDSLTCLGQNVVGQLGRGHNTPYHSFIPEKVLNLKNIKFAEASMYTSYAIDEDNNVYVWGSLKYPDAIANAGWSVPVKVNYSFEDAIVIN